MALDIDGSIINIKNKLGSETIPANERMELISDLEMIENFKNFLNMIHKK